VPLNAEIGSQATSEQPAQSTKSGEEEKLVETTTEMQEAGEQTTQSPSEATKIIAVVQSEQVSTTQLPIETTLSVEGETSTQSSEKVIGGRIF
jgi:hypothetical protein